VVVTDIPLLPEERASVALHADRPLEPERTVVLVPVSGINDATTRAVVYAKSLRPSAVEALFFGTDPAEETRIVEEWGAAGMDIPLSVVEAPFRDYGAPLLQEVRRHTVREDTVVTVVLPEIVVRHWWEQPLHGQTALFFKRLLIFEPRVVVTSVPFRL
jgi:hypothetical protein